MCTVTTVSSVYTQLFLFPIQGDLGTIPDKYDVAVSTASPALDYVVVDTMETGIKCVEFLKNANLGTTTFIAMDKVNLIIHVYW